MAIAQGMKEIAQGIVSSREVRVAAVKGLKKEAAEMLGSAEASRDEMGAQLRQDLAHDRAKMGAEAKALRKALADYNRGIKSEVAGMRQETKADLGEARTAWQELTPGVKKAAVKAMPKVVRAEVAQAAPVKIVKVRRTK